jgi:hypothetical protein
MSDGWHVAAELGPGWGGWGDWYRFKDGKAVEYKQG